MIQNKLCTNNIFFRLVVCAANSLFVFCPRIYSLLFLFFSHESRRLDESTKMRSRACPPNTPNTPNNAQTTNATNWLRAAACFLPAGNQRAGSGSDLASSRVVAADYFRLFCRRRCAVNVIYKLENCFSTQRAVVCPRAGQGALRRHPR